MLKTCKYLCLMLVFLPHVVFGIIKETEHFAEILNYVTQETLVLLDLDDTLLVPNQTIGTDVWFEYRLKSYLSTGLPFSQALEKSLTEWQAVRHLSQVSIVEEGTQAVIENLQQQGIQLMGLTTQQFTLCSTTLCNLATLGINLSKTAPWSEDLYFMNIRGALYQQGIMFTSGTPKGPALLKFFKLTGCWPKHVLFINDKSSHLEDVEKSLVEVGIPFTGLRYSYRDASVANFSPEIADIQWQYSTLTHLLSDEEAQEILATQASLLLTEN